MIRYYKALPGHYVMKYRNGKLLRKGKGLSFFYFKPLTAIVEIPLESRELPFIFSELTEDFQELTIQGQIAWQITDPEKIAEQLDFTVNEQGYINDDFVNLPERILNIAQEQLRAGICVMKLRAALKEGYRLADETLEKLKDNGEIGRLGLTLLALRITAIKANPETARALEAGEREKILQQADEATYRRRNAAIEQERTIQENELNTEIALKEKEREVQNQAILAKEEAMRAEAKMERERRENEILLEQKNQELVQMRSDNTKKTGEADAFSVKELMKAYNTIDPALMEAVKYTGMNPVQLLADGFRELAKNNGKIGQLNITPDIVQALMQAGKAVAKGAKP